MRGMKSELTKEGQSALGHLSVVAALNKKIVAASTVAIPKKETMASGYSQNQSQGIESDVYKEKVCTDSEGMGPT